jgi:hypothetical protein
MGQIKCFYKQVFFRQVYQLKVIKIKQVAWNKSSLLLRNNLQNTQTAEQFTMNIKTESINKVIQNAKLGGLGRET